MDKLHDLIRNLMLVITFVILVTFIITIFGADDGFSFQGWCLLTWNYKYIFIAGFIACTANCFSKCEGAFYFRDTRDCSINNDWEEIGNTDGNKWKNRILQTVEDYNIIEATVMTHSLGNLKLLPPIGPISNQLISLFCHSQGGDDIYLSFEKVFSVIGKGGIYTTISNNREDSLKPMNNEYGRYNLGVGIVKWRNPITSQTPITLKSLLQLYTETSSDLSPNYQMYLSNGQSFGNALVTLLNQLKKRWQTTDETSDKGQDKGSTWYQKISRWGLLFVAWWPIVFLIVTVILKDSFSDYPIVSDLLQGINNVTDFILNIDKKKDPKSNDKKTI